MTEHS